MSRFRKAAQADARTKRDEEIARVQKVEAADEQIKVGDIVMKHREPFERFNKLDDKWIGPYLVRRSFDNGGFEIEGMDGKKFRYNARKLQRMEGTDPHTWESFESGSVLPDDRGQEMALITSG